MAAADDKGDDNESDLYWETCGEVRGGMVAVVVVVLFGVIGLGAASMFLFWVLFW